MGEVVQVQDITKTYGKKGEKQYQALKGISFDVARGEFVGIMGASGSGKTTLLNILSTLDQPTTGNVYINWPIFVDKRLVLFSKILTY